MNTDDTNDRRGEMLQYKTDVHKHNTHNMKQLTNHKRNSAISATQNSQFVIYKHNILLKQHSVTVTKTRHDHANSG